MPVVGDDIEPLTFVFADGRLLKTFYRMAATLLACPRELKNVGASRRVIRHLQRPEPGADSGGFEGYIDGTACPCSQRRTTRMRLRKISSRRISANRQ